MEGRDSESRALSFVKSPPLFPRSSEIRSILPTASFVSSLHAPRFCSPLRGESEFISTFHRAFPGLAAPAAGRVYSAAAACRAGSKHPAPAPGARTPPGCRRRPVPAAPRRIPQAGRDFLSSPGDSSAAAEAVRRACHRRRISAPARSFSNRSQAAARDTAASSHNTSLARLSVTARSIAPRIEPGHSPRSVSSLCHWKAMRSC